MSRYTHAQVSKMLIDPHWEGVSIFDEYPQLTVVAERFPDSQVVWHAYFRYLSLCYDPHSPMVKTFPDIRQRRQEAAMEAVYEGEHFPIIAIEFVKTIVKRRTWIVLCSMDNTFDEYATRVNIPISNSLDEDKALKAVELKNKMLETMVQMIASRDNLMKQMFDNDSELLETEGEITNFTPENVAKSIRKKN